MPTTHQLLQFPSFHPAAGIAIEVYYDGECPLCLREVRWLRHRDRRDRIRFTDIADPGFVVPASLTHTELMARIHGRLSTGELITGVEVFRILYTAIGFGTLVAITRLPGIAQVLDLGYIWFARNRLRLTGRCKAGACTIAAAKPPIAPHPAAPDWRRP
jgi:predicted DCC family thiol-disulfide oxidoreductase YuxK